MIDLFESQHPPPVTPAHPQRAPTAEGALRKKTPNKFRWGRAQIASYGVSPQTDEDVERLCNPCSQILSQIPSNTLYIGTCPQSVPDTFIPFICPNDQKKARKLNQIETCWKFHQLLNIATPERGGRSKMHQVRWARSLNASNNIGLGRAGTKAASQRINGADLIKHLRYWKFLFLQVWWWT